jgi:hypothetical protein
MAIRIMVKVDGDGQMNPALTGVWSARSRSGRVHRGIPLQQDGVDTYP